MSVPRPGRVIVFGNEKGGTGKSTAAVHVIAALLHAGRRVAAVDLDVGQGSLGRYLANREAYAARSGVTLPQPDFRPFAASALADRDAAAAADEAALEALLAGTAACDYVVVDTPGSAGHLNRIGHARADILISPINDSFVDLDLLAEVDTEPLRVRRPSRYAEMVWDVRKLRARRDGGSIDWIVMRNRQAAVRSRNMQRVDGILRDLSGRIGFRLAPGFGERVIFRELFPLGLTLLDLADAGVKLTLSRVAARNEVRGLMRALGPPLPRRPLP